MYNYDELQKLQQEALNIYKEFKRICDKHELCFFAIGGTCIGAVRHNGFIPWDDDIDVAMPYEDICKFKEIIRDELKAGYSLYDPKEKKHFYNNHLKLQNDNTAFIEKGMLNFPESYYGVFIDIMPIFGLPTGKEREHVLKKYDQYMRLNPKMRRPFQDMISPLSKMAWILNFWRRLICPFNYYTEKINSLLRKYSLNSSDKIIFGWRRLKNKVVFDYDYKCVFDFEDFSDYILMPFEDTYMRGPKVYDSYLTSEFGNYMTLPPEEKRVPIHHVGILDFNKSYKSYAEERN